MKSKLLLLLLMCIGATSMLAQTISGKVTDAENGESLIGVNILVIGSDVGVITDIDGNYRIDAPSDATLRFTYTGYADQEIPVAGQSVVNVILESGVALDEVVVTALGIERSKKSLASSVTELGGEGFQESREINVANSLAGKIAGVNVSNIASGPQGSSRVVIRGNVSLSGNNQPLYVIDGVPLDNSGFGQAGLWGGADEGDGTSSINPDDIETLTVLKGANAAALYGSRASNGVILITTKSGSQRKGIGIEFQSNYVIDKPFDRLDLQSEYGHGRQGEKPADAAEAWSAGTSDWGARLDGSSVPQFDGQSRPYTDVSKANFDKFYNTGTTWTNSLGFSGGGDNQTIRINMANLENKGILPNSGFTRRNVSLSYNGKYADKLTLTSKILYSNENAKNRPRVSDSPGNAPQGLVRLPRNYDVDDLRGDPDRLGTVPVGVTTPDNKGVGDELQISTNLWNQNPWFAAYQFENSDLRDRIITSQSARFDVTDFLYVQGRVGMDWYTRRETDITPFGTGYQRRGSMTERERRQREINVEGLVGFDETFGDFSVNAFVGGNRMRRNYDEIRASGSNFNIPFFYDVENGANQSLGTFVSKEGINSVFGSATLGYKNFLYLTGTARQDKFSTLNPETNDILYPSVGASLIFSELMNTSNGVFTYGKLRGSWAQVGGATSPYQLALTYGLGQGHLGTTNASISQNSVPNPLLKPLLSTELEFGFDLRFFNNRLGVDFTWYKQNTEDDILSATISSASGFGGATINIGEVENTGVELLLTGRPYQSKDFNWDVTFNFSFNDSEVIALSDGIESIQIGEPRTRFAFINQVVGQPFSTITGFTQEMINGQPVFDPNTGFPVRSAGTSILGNGVHRFIGGLTNEISWKDLYLNFLIDFKTGGDIYSGTNVRLVGAGSHKMTVGQTTGLGFVSNGRESITVTGVDPEGNPLTMDIDQEDVSGFWGRYQQLSDRFIYDASFIKFRQLSLGYRIPRSLLEKTPVRSASLSFVARNLFLMLTNLENVDPESNYQNTNAQGLDYFGVPQTRSYGVNLKVTF